jgi:hypothetical protein
LIGRNINQIAHALNRGEHTAGPTVGNLQAVLRAISGSAITPRGSSPPT